MQRARLQLLACRANESGRLTAGQTIQDERRIAGDTRGARLPLDDLACENYLCVHVPNVPGVLGKVASCLGRHGVSIKRMNQDTPGPGEPIDMVILTERTREAQVVAAIAEVDTFDLALMPTHRFRILEPEQDS